MKRALVLAALAFAALTASGCSRARRYESAVQIVRKEAVEKDADRFGPPGPAVRGGKPVFQCSDLVRA